MSVANLCSRSYNDVEKITTLENGSLAYIDGLTSAFANAEEFKQSAYYKEKASSPDEEKLVLLYVKNNKEKLELNLLFNDDDPIRSRTSTMDDNKTEVERARKLLLNSKNQMFLTSFLLDKNLSQTTNSTVKMTMDEYKVAKKEGYKVTVLDGEYRISIKEVLRYRLNNKKLGLMRLLVEDTLEVWKTNMMNLTDEELYFYSRELRLLINEYNYRKIPRKAVYNLTFNNRQITNDMKVKRSNKFRINNTKGLNKRKVLEEYKAA